MKKIWLTEKDNKNVAVWYLDDEGDLFDNKKDAEICGIDKEIITKGFYVGGLEDWKRNIKTAVKEYFLHENEVKSLRNKYADEIGKYSTMMEYLDLAVFEGIISQNESNRIEAIYF